jgi:hypothetical protein
MQGSGREDPVQDGNDDFRGMGLTETLSREDRDDHGGQNYREPISERAFHAEFQV